MASFVRGDIRDINGFSKISRDFGDFYDREHIIYINLIRSRGIIPLNTSRNGSKHGFLVIFGDFRRFSTIFRYFGDFCDRERSIYLSLTRSRSIIIGETAVVLL